MLNIFLQQKMSFRFHHPAATTIELTALTATPAALKAKLLFFWLKNKNPLMKPLTLSKTFPYLLNFPSTNSNLVTCLTVYKEDKATH